MFPHLHRTLFALLTLWHAKWILAIDYHTLIQSFNLLVNTFTTRKDLFVKVFLFGDIVLPNSKSCLNLRSLSLRPCPTQVLGFQVCVTIPDLFVCFNSGQFKMYLEMMIEMAMSKSFKQNNLFLFLSFLEISLNEEHEKLLSI